MQAKHTRTLIIACLLPTSNQGGIFADRGLELQYRDSQMAEQIMPTFTKAEKPILHVPDSFLVLLDGEELLLK